MLATHIGTFPLPNKITLTNVLYLLNLNYPLIYVSKLLEKTNCFSLLTDTLFFVHNRFTRMLIGSGEERDGVHFFKDVMAAKVCVTAPFVSLADQQLWYQSLAHPSLLVLDALPFSSVLNISVAQNPCDTCFRGKQNVLEVNKLEKHFITV